MNSNIKKAEAANHKGWLTPARVLGLGFACLILLGALLLMLPFATVDGLGMPIINALFTSTSAVCVTGLAVADTGTYFTVFGQITILLLIQVGGLGFMTFVTLFAIIMGRRITLKERILLQEALNQVTLEGIVRLTKSVVQMTLVIESVGAVILALRWGSELGWQKAVYYGIFHAISSFNNAGFDLFGEYRSLTAYTADLTVNLVIMSLIILGGLGFAVISELYVYRDRKKLGLHSYVVLRSTSVLVPVGAAIVFLLEFNNPGTMGVLPLPAKITASFFQAVTTRTAGYNTLPVGALRDTTLLIMIIFMFIGASPGSTGGGIKTTTFVSLVSSVIASLKGQNEVVIRERTLPREIIQKAVTITALALLLVLSVTALLTLTEMAGFLQLLFETTSAFATVGLSTGITRELTSLGKTALAFTMYAGRVGPFTLAYALAHKNKVSLSQIKYPEERIIIG